MHFDCRTLRCPQHERGAVCIWTLRRAFKRSLFPPDLGQQEIVAELSEVYLAALSKAEAKRVLPRKPNVQDAMLEVDRLGGHIKNNGPPGWLILRRGLNKLLTIHRGRPLEQESQ